MSEWINRLAAWTKNNPPKPNQKPVPKVERQAKNVQEYITGLRGQERIAFLSLLELVSQGKAEFLFIREPEIAKFWEKHVDKINAIEKVSGRANKPFNQ